MYSKYFKCIIRIPGQWTWQWRCFMDSTPHRCTVWVDEWFSAFLLVPSVHEELNPLWGCDWLIQDLSWGYVVLGCLGCITAEKTADGSLGTCLGDVVWPQSALSALSCWVSTALVSVYFLLLTFLWQLLPVQTVITVWNGWLSRKICVCVGL